MNQPWGISGPQFLGWYMGALVVSIVVALVVQGLLRRVPRTSVDDVRPVPGADGGGFATNTYTLAALAGGERRVVDTAVQALIEGSVARVSRDHRITVCGEAPDEPVQRAVFDCFGPHERTLQDVRSCAQGTKPVRWITSAAVERGLLLDARRRRAVTSTILLPLVVFGVGIARLVNGLHLKRPVGYLLVLLAITAIVIVVMGYCAPRRTWAGQEFLRQEELRPRTGRNQQAADTGSSPGVLVSAAVLGVALLGAEGVRDESLRQALYGSTGSSGSGSSSGCGSTSNSCGSSSSCGGGGCGG